MRVFRAPASIWRRVDHVKIVDEFDIVERHRRVLRDGPLQLDVVREADRQSTNDRER
jgi:hypothetical protein